MGFKDTVHKIGAWRDKHPGTAMVIEIGVILCLTWFNTKRTYKVAYSDGYAAGLSPIKLDELKTQYDAGHRSGHSAGYTKGLWSSQPEAYREGMADGANLAADANMVAFEAIRRSQYMPQVGQYQSTPQQSLQSTPA